MENFENECAIEDVQPKKFEPTLGMLCDSYKEMFEFYKAYGKQEGFPVKKLTSKKENDETVKYATFTCGRSSKADSRYTNMLKLKPVVKTGCEARIEGCVNEEGKWILRTLNLQHNHGLSPDKARYFPCNHRISASVKKRIEMNDSAGINIAQNFNSIVVEDCGHENVSFLEKYCRNLVNKARRLQLGEEDAMSILKYFEKKNKQNAMSFFLALTWMSRID